MNQDDHKKWTRFDLFNQVPLNIAVIDLKYRIVDANATFIETFGPWEGKKCYQAYKHRKRVCRKCQAAETFADGKNRVSLEKVRDRKGNLRYLRVRMVPYRDENGTITHVVEMSADVTDRERALEQHQTIFDNVPCYITVIDKNFRIVTANKYFEKTFGKNVGTYCFESYKNRTVVCDECPAKRAFKDGRSHHALQEGYDKKGKKIYYMVTVTPYLKEKKQVNYVIEMALNVTKIFLLEKRLKEMEFQEEIIQNAMSGIIASAKDGQIKIYNPLAQRILKYPKNKVIGKKRGDELYPPDFLNAIRGDDSAIVLKESKIKDYRGNNIPIMLSGRRIKNDAKNIDILMFFQDLSKIKQLEKEILEAERLAAVGQTVAGLSHGIKNILMGLEGGMYVVNSGIKRNDNNLVKQGWDMLQSNIEKVSSFVREFLSFAKGTAPKVALTDPYSIATEVVNLYKDAATQSGITLLTKLQKGIPKVPMDAQGIHTCIANLISNAIDACLISDAKKPTVEFFLFEKKGAICYEVKDNGCGMDYEVKKKIFTNFFTTKGSGQGTGLGLLTTRKIVQEHGGKISFKSTLGKGSAFKIEFPLSRLPVPEEKRHSLLNVEELHERRNKENHFGGR